MHECVFSGKRQVAESGVHTSDIAKRLIDYGYHPPDHLFSFNCSRSDYDRTDRDGKQGNPGQFCEAMIAIALEAKENPDGVKMLH